MIINEHEMRGLITGKAMPADIFVGESLAAYLVRKFTALHNERDALAVECAQYKSLAERFAERADEYKSEHFGYSVFDSSNEVKQHIKTPAIDAYLNSMRADELGKVAALINLSADKKQSEGYADCARDRRDLAVHFLTMAHQLRAGKDDE